MPKAMPDLDKKLMVKCRVLKPVQRNRIVYPVRSSADFPYEEIPELFERGVLVPMSVAESQPEGVKKPKDNPFKGFFVPKVTDPSATEKESDEEVTPEDLTELEKSKKAAGATSGGAGG